MYSVIIQNRQTADSFHLHYALFLDALVGDRFGVCRWNEEGTTIETALPELAELTDDKPEWRAVIVHTEDGESMAEYGRSARNPFDFSLNETERGCTAASPIPLIRLTHILGGVPAPIRRFSEQIVADKTPPYVIYTPVEDAQEDAAYARLSALYAYDGKKPAEIILVTLRTRNEDTETLSRRAWSNASENTSSNFWQRNHYPSACRFIVFETTKQGKAERAAELFRFWTGVLLLATNDIEPNFLQAYRLYRLDVAIHAKRLCDAIQQSVNRLAGARAAMDESIRVALERRLNESGNLPDYSVSVPVNFDFSTKPIKKMTGKRFRFAPKNLHTQMLLWQELRGESERAVTAAFRATDRTLAQSAERLHGVMAYTPHDVRRLDKYEVQDFERSLDETYDGAMHLLEKLPRDPLHKNGAAETAAKAVSSAILAGVTRGQAAMSLAAVVGLLGLSLVPALILRKTRGIGSLPVMGIALLICAALAALTALTVLCIRKYAVAKAVRRYGDKLRKSLAALLVSGQDFEQYLSKIASHVRGASYLKVLRRKNCDEELLLEARKAHVRASDALLSRLREWSVAFHLPVNFGEDAIEDNVAVDPLCPPYRNRVYTFEQSLNHTPPLNHSGDLVESPFEFVTQLEIVREELYNDE